MGEYVGVCGEGGGMYVCVRVCVCVRHRILPKKLW